MFNSFVADQILGQILAFPETHDQNNWENTNECGTTRCIAGWAIHFSDQFEVETREQDCSCGCGAPRLRTSPVRKSDGSVVDWVSAGAEILGIDNVSAEILFHTFDDESAIQKLKMLANGQQIEEDPEHYYED